MKSSFLIVSFLVQFLFSSLSQAWNAETNCSFLKEGSELGTSYFVNFTIKASTDSNAYLKLLTVIVADGSNFVFFQEGQNPTKETVLLSYVKLASSQLPQSQNIDFHILEEPKNLTPPHHFENLSMIEFTQKVSIVGLSLELSAIDLDCSTIETLDQK